MYDWLVTNAWVVWLALFLLLAIIEMISLDLYFIMLGVGALGGVTVALLGGEFWLQMVVFSVTALLMIMLVRPIALRHLRKDPEGLRTNVDRLIGEDALVLEPTSRMNGRAKIGGETWSARTEDDVALQPGTYGSVVRIEGATAYITLRTQMPGLD
ncbi:NfeD family protein [Paeniglutamicibacter psychrophenolicus]|uniref:Membrane protein implicated in regulation of membrane protease activity n=1 Tax=Paeniglutamicibacter psychrophenolicus TaxID=257454 RepID=A0ABS4WEZ1_9MICC|nr:NfeD family protein [Paeniglutamicibacter psychrophenolicus]MBP2374740.1 membrane protein implicated in regulation of membrane protease activity [Paeniglutamicibacter psychrophenolicus]